MQLVDSHSHIDADEFDADRAAVVERARAAGVARQVVPAVDAISWPKLRDVCAAIEGLFPAYGLHPTFLAGHAPQHLGQLREWIERERPLAVGECGLDHFVEGLDRAAQLHYFEAQLEIAREFDLPVIVHARRAVEEVLLAIRRVGGLRGVVHSFSGSRQQAEQLWENGFLVGLGGPVTYARARRIRRLAASMPLQYLLLETDAPDQPDCHTQGQRNEPARLTAVLDAIAVIRDQDPAEIAAITTANAERLFNLPSDGSLLDADHADRSG
ncbi:MAG: TatD family deoxyribonuclease [Lysobacteraceae bacterium]|nr:MAG: TatD family deoxyribonuclease [Xanthomonadaceae bacterium]